MRHEVFVGLGSNLGDPVQQIKEALRRMQEKDFISDFETSKLYKTKAISPYPQPDFINAVCRFKTAVTPAFLLERLEGIEASLGKEPKPKWAPRPIDLDILFFGTQSVQTKELHIPHPHWSERLFVLRPLSDLVSYVPGFEPPVSVQEMIEKLEQEVEVLA